MKGRLGPSTHISPFNISPLFPSFCFVQFLHMFLKCVVQREEILAVSGFKETLSPVIVRERKTAGCASKSFWKKAGNKEVKQINDRMQKRWH